VNLQFEEGDLSGMGRKEEGAQEALCLNLLRGDRVRILHVTSGANTGVVDLEMIASSFMIPA